MEHRSLALGSRLTAGAVVFASLLAGVTPAGAEDGLALKRERADQLEREARQLRGDAARQFKEDEAECRQRILVNDCIKGAKERRLERIEAARRKEAEQAAIERELRYAEHSRRKEAKQRQRATEGPPPAAVIREDEPKADSATPK